MADITQAVDRAIKEDGALIALPMAVVKIVRGSAVFKNAAGFATGTFAASLPFLGICEGTKDNTTGAAGSKLVATRRVGVARFETTGMVQTDVGEKVYLSDNTTVTKTAVGNSLAGTIVVVESATAVWVDILKAIGV